MKFKIGDRVRIKDSDDKTIWEIIDTSKDREGNKFVSYLIDTENEENYSDVIWYEEELEFVEDNIESED